MAEVIVGGVEAVDNSAIKISSAAVPTSERAGEESRIRSPKAPGICSLRVYYTAFCARSIRSYTHMLRSIRTVSAVQYKRNGSSSLVPLPSCLQ
ncbi:Hypothetical protein NTJ_04332 [Nesidiocoris tenuis]|uniref:Uncharacterized protein n=1 Tax=Nesidiocoris tenuis TaxID=355587 RepID=A0ABN7AH10_9HEMI|nr:Hypothetical protein NTJ_04332 [Nesidiocoris tenuis]